MPYKNRNLRHNSPKLFSFLLYAPVSVLFSPSNISETWDACIHGSQDMAISELSESLRISSEEWQWGLLFALFRLYLFENLLVTFSVILSVVFKSSQPPSVCECFIFGSFVSFWTWSNCTSATWFLKVKMVRKLILNSYSKVISGKTLAEFEQMTLMVRESLN